ncbi:MAG TPA: antitoxin [Mycobacterium sp.]|nr:antitoxin [Mycobacterium sp.]
MSFLDKAKDALEKVVAGNSEKVGEAIDKAGDFVDEKTDGKFKDAVDKVQDAAKNAADKVGHEDSPPA